MGTSPESKKRKAPSEASWDARPVKTTRTSRYRADGTPHSSSVAKAIPCGRSHQSIPGNGLRATEGRVLGSFPDALQAGTVLLGALNTAFVAIEQPLVEGEAQQPCINEIHWSQHDETGELCVMHRDTQPSKLYHTHRPNGLRFGNSIPASATKSQQITVQSPVFVVATRTGEATFRQTQAAGAETIAVYRSAHEANQHVLKEFGRCGGFQNRRSAADPDEMSIADELDHHEGPTLCFVDGFAQARVVRGAHFMHWEVIQKSWY